VNGGVVLWQFTQSFGAAQRARGVRRVYRAQAGHGGARAQVDLRQHALEAQNPSHCSRGSCCRSRSTTAACPATDSVGELAILKPPATKVDAWHAEQARAWAIGK